MKTIENLLYDAVGVGSGTAAELGTWFQAVLFSLRFDITQDDRCTICDLGTYCQVQNTT